MRITLHGELATSAESSTFDLLLPTGVPYDDQHRKEIREKAGELLELIGGGIVMVRFGDEQ